MTRSPGGGLPIDPDADGARVPHLQPGLLALVGLGGAIGTAGRAALATAVPAVGGVPVATLTVNLAGAFLLGVLLEALARAGPDAGARRRLRLLFGTGVVGGFTTYSSFATESAVLLLHGSTGVAVGYGLGTVVVGGCATWLGIAAASLGRGHSQGHSQGHSRGRGR